MPSNFQLQTENVDVIVHPKRKSIALSVEGQKIIIRSPRQLRTFTIQRLISEHKSWLIKKLIDAPEPIHFKNGDKLPFQGQTLNLVLVNTSTELIYQKEDELIISSENLTTKSIQNQLINWYFVKAHKLLQQITFNYAPQIGVNPHTIKVKSFRSRWGSAHLQGYIQYHYKLIMAPIEVIQYVVIHELCHFIYHNHSKYFWLLVEKHCPHYKKSRTWLKRHGNKIFYTLTRD